jgi:hypothetical protein
MAIKHVAIPIELQRDVMQIAERYQCSFSGAVNFILGFAFNKPFIASRYQIPKPSNAIKHGKTHNKLRNNIKINIRDDYNVVVRQYAADNYFSYSRSLSYLIYLGISDLLEPSLNFSVDVPTRKPF